MKMPKYTFLSICIFRKKVLALCIFACMIIQDAFGKHQASESLIGVESRWPVRNDGASSSMAEPEAVNFPVAGSSTV
jgi:hypothetical protein